MFDVLQNPPPDPILQLAVQFRDDPRDGKIDLGIGVYKDAQGRVPIMAAVKAAEHLLLRDESTKNYLGLSAHEGFAKAISALVLGPDIDQERVSSLQATGGQGAVRLLMDLVRMAAPQATVWISNPSWANHYALADFLGMPRRAYRYYDPATGAVDFDAMTADLREARKGDVVILHACCHNPTGADLSLDQWREVARLAQRQGFIPFIDAAYQGLGNGNDADAAGLRLVAQSVPEALVAVSCSKSFAIYRDRVGCALVLAASRDVAQRARAQLMAIARVNYSMPPNHGAAAVATVLERPDLRAQWLDELDGMRASMRQSRAWLAAALRRQTNGARFDFILAHNGMFSFLGLSPAQVEALKAEHGVFILPNSRVNVAGVTEVQAERVAAAIAAVTASVP